MTTSASSFATQAEAEAASFLAWLKGLVGIKTVKSVSVPTPAQVAPVVAPVMIAPQVGPSTVAIPMPAVGVSPSNPPASAGGVQLPTATQAIPVDVTPGVRSPIFRKYVGTENAPIGRPVPPSFPVTYVKR